MNDKITHKKLNNISWLLALNAALTALLAGTIVFYIVPKVNGVEERFHSFADEVEPVIKSSAGKANDFLEGMDTEAIGDDAEERARDILDAAAEKAEKILKGD